jgi:hypothetical protein
MGLFGCESIVHPPLFPRTPVTGSMLVLTDIDRAWLRRHAWVCTERVFALKCRDTWFIFMVDFGALSVGADLTYASEGGVCAP